MRFLRWLAIWICVPIYKTIPKMYSIFYFLANARFLEEGVVDELSKNLYVLISVVMLFTFAATLLSAIVNPDMLDDGAKKIWAPFKRAIIGLILIILIPFAFDKAYELQADIMNNAVIEKIILGVNYSSENTIGSEGGVSKGGQLIAGNLISSVLYPSNNQDEVEVDNSAFAQAYNNMISSDISNITTVAQHINDAPAGSTVEDEYALDFDGLIALIAGGVTIYILLLYAFDMAVRMFTLAFYELTAPIAIIAYIGLGNKYIMNWAKEVGKVYADVFIRIAAMGFYLFLVSNLTTFFNSPTLWGISEDANVQSVSGFGWRLLLQVIIIVGMLGFVYKVPELIGKAFGIQMGNGARGLAGRLQPVRQAFQDLNNARQGLGRVAGATAAIGANIGARGVGSFRREWRNREGQNGARRLAAALGAGLVGTGAGALTFGGAARRGWQTGNLTSIGNEVARDRNTHPDGSTFGGRMADILTQSIGMGTALDRANDRIARQNRYEYNGQHYTRDQLNGFAEQYNRLTSETQGALDSVNAELDREDSTFLQQTGNNHFQFIYEERDAQGNLINTIHNDYVATNFQEMTETLRALRESGPQADNYYEREVVDANGNVTRVSCNPRDAGAQLNLQALNEAQARYQASINALEDQIRARRQQAQEFLVQNTGDWTNYNRAHDNTNALNTQHHIDVANNYINTLHAPTDGDRITDANGNNLVINNFQSLQNANDQSTTTQNALNRSINRTDAARNAQYQTEEYMRQQMNNQANDAYNSDQNTIHTTGQDANNNYR